MSVGGECDTLIELRAWECVFRPRDEEGVQRCVTLDGGCVVDAVWMRWFRICEGAESAVLYEVNGRKWRTRFGSVGGLFAREGWRLALGGKLLAWALPDQRVEMACLSR